MAAWFSNLNKRPFKSRTLKDWTGFWENFLRASLRLYNSSLRVATSSFSLATSGDSYKTNGFNGSNIGSVKGYKKWKKKKIDQECLLAFGSKPYQRVKLWGGLENLWDHPPSDTEYLTHTLWPCKINIFHQPCRNSIQNLSRQPCW